MLQSEIWRSVRVAPLAVAPAQWWRRRRAVLALQISVLLVVIAVASAALVASEQHARQRAALRLAETSRFLDEFRAGRAGEAAARVRTAWQTEAARHDALAARLATAAGSDLGRQRRNYQLFVLEVIEEHGLAPEIEILRQYIARLATCAGVGNCDRAAVTAQLGPALWAFRDQHLPYFQFEHSGLDLDAHLAVIAPRPSAGPPWL